VIRRASRCPVPLEDSRDTGGRSQARSDWHWRPGWIALVTREAGAVDGQATAVARTDLQPRAMCLGDCLNDRESEAHPVPVTRAIRTRSLERLQQTLDPTGATGLVFDTITDARPARVPTTTSMWPPARL
jgi:hypothetical protein